VRRDAGPLRAKTIASRALLAAAIAGSALAVGTVHTVTLCIVSVVLVAAAGLAWWGSEPVAVRSSATLALAVGVGLTLYTAFQCVPLPMALLSRIAPHNADVWSRALSPLREGAPRWAPLTLDPSATRVEVLKGTAYLLAFVTALRVAHRRSGAGFLNLVLISTGFVLAVTALLHPAFGAHRVFGVYEPSEVVNARHVAPLLNPNNLAGYLNVALCLALAATVAPEPPVPRAAGAAVVLFLVGTQLWVASRGGVIAMGLGIFVVIAVSRMGRSDPRRAAARVSLVAGFGTAVGVALIVLAGSDDASNELFVSDVSKLKLVWIALRMLPAVPIFGCGRGAFESAFSAFRSGYTGHVTMVYPENVVAQWLLEWGLPVGVGGLLLLAIALRPSAALARSTSAVGAWAALLALAVQELGDLGSEVPGLAIAGVVCAAVVVAGTPGHRSRWRVERWARFPRAIGAVAVSGGWLAIAAAALGLGNELHDDQSALHDAAIVHPLPAADLHARVRPMLLRHPAEPYLPFLVALRASMARNDDPMPWIEATLERAPVYGPAHLILARLLAARSPSQARMEYRLAMEQVPDLFQTVVAEAPRLVHDYFEAMELVPDGKRGEAVLESLATSLGARLPATSVRLDAELQRRAPGQLGPPLRAARGAVADLAAPWCQGPARPGCAEAALGAAARAAQIAPRESEPRALHARARMATGDRAGAIQELQSAADEVTDRVGCLQELVAVTIEVGDTVRAEQTLDAIANAGCATDAECVRQLTWVGTQEEARGSPRKALTLYDRAIERSPESDGPLALAAALAGRLGLHAEAAEHYRELAKRHPAEATWAHQAEVERDAALRGGLPK
jgi:tetratricopeptide (TPR) repeat protein